MADEPTICAKCHGTGREPGLIAVRTLAGTGYAKSVRQDDVLVWKFSDPICKVWGEIDADQFAGTVSIDCPNCVFHETLNIRSTVTGGS